jgi:RNA polymerase-binding transcription factor DksA
MLTSSQVAELERRLGLRLMRLRKEIAAVRKQREDDGTRGVFDRKDEADARAQAAIADAEVERDMAELREVRFALQRIGVGSYGVCACCGADIGADRLMAEPQALRCIACQEQSELAAELSAGTWGRQKRHEVVR